MAPHLPAYEFARRVTGGVLRPFFLKKNTPRILALLAYGATDPYFGGSCHICMIDNTHVVVLQGTGQDMVPVPEMASFAERYAFQFQAHEKGDANRSARVERQFHYIENNFLAGRRFQDWDDANRQARNHCSSCGWGNSN